MLPPVIVLALFSLGSGFSKTFASILITRFLGGVFGSAPISNVSAALGDLYAPQSRGTAMSFYAICVNGGPALAPLIGAAVTVNPRLGWRCKLYSDSKIHSFLG
jgi:MFS family permease